MSTSTSLAVVDAPPPPAQLGRGVEQVTTAIDALKAIRTFVQAELVRDVDYGEVVKDAKPTLLKAGAEKIALYYQTRPAYHVDRNELGEGHVEFMVRCELIARSNGAIAAEGYGSCTTMESKYRWRKSDRQCPACGQSMIIKGKDEFGGGWLCYKAKGGCGAKYRDGDKAIEGQQVGRTPNPDIWDQRNPCLKIAMKRSLVSAVLSLGSLSELFTQDIEDTYDLSTTEPPRPPSDAGREANRVIDEAMHASRQAHRPSAPPPKVDNQTGHGSGKYASPEDVSKFGQAVRSIVDEANASWVESWHREHGEVPSGIKSEVVNEFQLIGHIVKWGLRSGHLADVGVAYDPETGKPVDRVRPAEARKYGGILWHRHRDALLAEARGYIATLARNTWTEWHGQVDESDPEIDIDATEQLPPVDPTEAGSAG